MNAREGIKTQWYRKQSHIFRFSLKTMNAREGIKTDTYSVGYVRCVS